MQPPVIVASSSNELDQAGKTSFLAHQLERDIVLAPIDEEDGRDDVQDIAGIFLQPLSFGRTLFSKQSTRSTPIPVGVHTRSVDGRSPSDLETRASPGIYMRIW